MARPSKPYQLSRLQNWSVFVFVVFCGLPALEMTGFGFGVPISFPVALTLATVGGGVGGVLMCHRPMLAGLFGGLLAGPLGVVALYYYVQHRERLMIVEIVLVQGIGSLPGYWLALMIKKMLWSPSMEVRADPDRAGFWPWS